MKLQIQTSGWVAAVTMFWLAIPTLTADTAAGVRAFRRGDYATALREWKPLAERGEPEAQFNLGTLYEKGLGVTKSYDEAFKWYSLAAAQGEAQAEYRLGEMYAHGAGKPQNYGEASLWFTRAAEQGDPDAETALAALYDEGEGTERNYQEAARYYRMAAEQENAQAQYRLGLLYERGRGVAKDPVQAYCWLTLAFARRQLDAGKEQERLTPRLTAEQLTQARACVRMWKPTKAVQITHK